MGTIVHAMRKVQEQMGKDLEECQHQSVMCQALLTHFMESHWVPIGNLLEQVGSRSVCGLFPTAPNYCDLHDGNVVTSGADRSASPSSLPSLVSVSSSSIDSIYYSPAFLQELSVSLSLSDQEGFVLLQGRSLSSSALPSTIPGDSGPFGDFDQRSFLEGISSGVPLSSDEGWGSGHGGGDMMGSTGEGY